MEHLNNDLSPLSKVWIYQSNRVFTPDEVTEIRQRVKDFAAKWTAHGEPVNADADVLYERFIVLMADERSFVSGCSIDSSVHMIRVLGNDFKADFFNRWLIAYLENGAVKQCDKAELALLIDTGVITDETIVFNNLVQTKRDFQEKWQLPFAQSWLRDVQLTHTPFSSVL